jgi:hypothetical protein
MSDKDLIPCVIVATKNQWNKEYSSNDFKVAFNIRKKYSSNLPQIKTILKVLAF